MKVSDVIKFTDNDTLIKIFEMAESEFCNIPDDCFVNEDNADCSKCEHLEKERYERVLFEGTCEYVPIKLANRIVRMMGVGTRENRYGRGRRSVNHFPQLCVEVKEVTE